MLTSLAPSRRRIALAAAAVIALFSAVVPPSPAQAAARAPSFAPAAVAADDPRWSVAPSTKDGPTNNPHFVLSATPGETLSSFVALDNLGTATTTFTVYATDAFTGPDGVFTLLTLNDPPKEVGTWFNLPPRTFAVDAGRRVIIPFEVTIPANARPGDHAGGVIASVTALQTNPDGKQVYVDRRIAARAYIRVSGPVTPGATVESFDASYQVGGLLGAGSTVATMRIRNTGNIRIDGTARVRIRGPLGLGLADGVAVVVPEMLPGAVVTLNTTVSGVLPLGPLDATLTYNPTSSEGLLPVATASVSLWAAPWGYLGVLAVILAVIVALVVLRRLRRTPLDPPVERELVSATHD